MKPRVLLCVMGLLVFLLAGVSQAQSPQPREVLPLDAVADSAPGPSAVPNTTWDIQHVDWGRMFGLFGDHGMLIDATDHIHIAYGMRSLYYAWNDGTSWQFETIDPSTTVGGYSSLALDTAGQLHVSYYDVGNGDLKYAYQDGTGWQIETVDSTGDVGINTSLALDADDYPYISYYDATNEALKCAYYKAGSWHLETVDSMTYAGDYSSLAMWEGQYPHIAYATGSDIKYAYQVGSGWYTEVVAQGGPAVSLAMDSTGRPHISYKNGVDGFDYAYHDGSAWVAQELGSCSGTGYCTFHSTALILDQFDHPHIIYAYEYSNLHPPIYFNETIYIYYDGSTWQSENTGVRAEGRMALALDTSGLPHIANIRYALYHNYSDGTDWQYEILDEEEFAGVYPSLALDTSGLPHISYVELAESALKYASYDGTTWQIETVFSLGLGTEVFLDDGPAHTSLVLDSSGQPHISYCVLSSYKGDLYYAYYDGTTWQIETVDSTGAVGEYSSLALDGEDRPHISYSDNTNYDLKYAYFDGTTWLTETVDSTGAVGEYSSLALDGEDRPHISYSDNTNYDLKYAYFDGTTWLTETVDSDGSVGDYTSLALDGEDRPHISYRYYTYLSGDLKYAHFDGSAWLTETVDSDGDVGGHTSLALDADGHPHITYVSEWSQDRLRYAFFDGNSWQTETVDTTDYTFQSTSLALDAAGFPHIAYYNASNRFLKYARGGEESDTYSIFLPVMLR